MGKLRLRVASLDRGICGGWPSSLAECLLVPAPVFLLLLPAGAGILTYAICGSSCRGERA